MARNAEKAHSMLNRYLKMKREEASKESGREPTRAAPSEVTSVPEAEKARSELIKNLSRKISDVQNPGLGEAKLRELNDLINKLLRTKHFWEKRILELGGPNYLVCCLYPSSPQRQGKADDVGYSGHYKELPGVKELLESARKQKAPRESDPSEKTQWELTRGVDAEYYGFGYETAEMLSAEAEAEKAHVDRLLEEFKAGRDVFTETEHVTEAAPVVADMAVPTNEAIEQALLDRRKDELLRKYGDASSAPLKQ